MTEYRINKNPQANGDNEVHKKSCIYYNGLTNFECLGDFLYCSTAIKVAKSRGYEKADGCIVCIVACHNS